jgi:uncharacterized RDD family membrane protein YckC
VTARLSRFWLRRSAAYAIDIVLLFVVLGPLGFGIQGLTATTPSTGREIWHALLLQFSLPAWLYFTIADASARGATFGKRWLGLRVASVTANGATEPRLTWPRALARTAVKLLPWELTHVAAFALAPDDGSFTVLQGIGLTIANVLAIAWFVVAIRTRGQRSVHDFAAGSRVSTTR